MIKNSGYFTKRGMKRRADREKREFSNNLILASLFKRFMSKSKKQVI